VLFRSPQNDLGWSCDILSGYPKAQGIITAVRTLSPQVIICDEIGGMDEAKGIIDSINAGVKVIASAHAASFSELLRRPAIVSLLESGAFEKAVMLSGPSQAGTIRRYVEVGELIGKTERNGPYRTLRLARGPEPGAEAEDEGGAAGGDDSPLQVSARQA
jgi:stage III sporulation protein AA